MEVVALLTESVDRNNDLFVEMSTDFVALLTESVDRNTTARKPRAAG